MRLEFWPSVVTSINPIPFKDGKLIEASSDKGIVNHLLHCVWWQGYNGNDVAFLEVVEEFFDRVAQTPSCTPLAIVHLILSRVCGAP